MDMEWTRQGRAADDRPYIGAELRLMILGVTREKSRAADWFYSDGTAERLGLFQFCAYLEGYPPYGTGVAWQG